MGAEIQPPEKILQALENIEAKKGEGKEGLQNEISALNSHRFFVSKTPKITEAQLDIHDRVAEVLKNVKGVIDPEVTAALERFAEKLERVLEGEEEEETEILRPAAPEEEDLQVVVGVPIEEGREGPTELGELPAEAEEGPTELGELPAEEGREGPTELGELPTEIEVTDEMVEEAEEVPGLLARTRKRAGQVLGAAKEYGGIGLEKGKAGLKTAKEYGVIGISETAEIAKGTKEIANVAIEKSEAFKIHQAFEAVEGYLEGIEKAPEMHDIIGKAIVEFAKKNNLPLSETTTQLNQYLQQEIFRGTEVLEADTGELKEELEEVENMSPKEVRERTYQIKKEMEEKGREKTKAEKKLADLEKDIARIEKRTTTTIETGTGAKMVQASEQDKERLKELETSLAETRGNIEQADQDTLLLNKRLNIVTHGTRNKLRKSRRVSAEIMLTHIHGFIYEKENSGKVDYEEKARHSLKATRESILKATTFIDKERRYKLRGASRKEVLAFLGSEKGPFAEMLSEGGRKVVGQLAEIKSKDLEGVKRWASSLNKKCENPEKFRQTLIDVVTNIQGLLDEKRFLKVGVDAFANRDLTILKNNIMHSYREHLALELKKELREKGESANNPEAMATLMDRVDNFNQSVMEARDRVDTNIPNDLKQFLKEYRKDYYYNKIGSGLKRGGKWLALSGTPKAFGFAWEKLKNNPKKITAAGIFTAASVFVGLWPATSTAIVGGTGYGAYRLYKRFKNPKKPATVQTRHTASNDENETKKAA